MNCKRYNGLFEKKLPKKQMNKEKEVSILGYHNSSIDTVHQVGLQCLNGLFFKRCPPGIPLDVMYIYDPCPCDCVNFGWPASPQPQDIKAHPILLITEMATFVEKTCFESIQLFKIKCHRMSWKHGNYIFSWLFSCEATSRN